MTATSPATQDETQPTFMLMTNRDLLSVIMLGGVIGMITWGLSWLLGNYVFEAILCGGDAIQCSSATMYAEITATILAAIAALFALVRLRVFRPMLVVIAATASLWGLIGAISSLPWYLVMIASIVLYALAYGLYVWIVRIRRFWVAAVVILLLIIAVRYIMTL